MEVGWIGLRFRWEKRLLSKVILDSEVCLSVISAWIVEKRKKKKGGGGRLTESM